MLINTASSNIIHVKHSAHQGAEIQLTGMLCREGHQFDVRLHFAGCSLLLYLKQRIASWKCLADLLFSSESCQFCSLLAGRDISHCLPYHATVKWWVSALSTILLHFSVMTLEKCNKWKKWGIFLKLQRFFFRFLRLFISFIHVTSIKGWAYVKFWHPPQRFWPFAEEDLIYSNLKYIFD